MAWKVVGALVFTLAVSSPAMAATPSWCSAAVLNQSERTICANTVLSRLDVQINEAYREAQRVAPDVDQREWLAERNRCGAGLTCLEKAYRSRIAELWAIAAGGPPRAGGDALRQGAGLARDRVPVLDTEAMSDLALPTLAETLDGDMSRRMSQALDEMTPRPWCAAGRLNPTEQTICGHQDLSRLDALLVLVYGRAAARAEDREQIRLVAARAGHLRHRPPLHRPGLRRADWPAARPERLGR